MLLIFIIFLLTVIISSDRILPAYSVKSLTFRGESMEMIKEFFGFEGYMSFEHLSFITF